MTAYFVLQIEWLDEAARKRYVEGISGMIEKHGGRYIVVSRDFQSVEGSWGKGLLVVIEFPTKQSLLEWYESPEYRPFRELRLNSSRSNAVVTDGV
jgi:uncharacterized protein (DUF1330 family)